MKLRFDIPRYIGIAAAFGILVFASYFNPYYVNAETKRKAKLYDQRCTATGDAERADRRAVNAGEITERDRALAKFWLSAYL